MAFCKYCGKELVNGVCNCPDAVAQRQAQQGQAQQSQTQQAQAQQSQTQQAQAQQAQPYQQGQPYQYGQFQQSEQYQKAQNYFGSVMKLITEFCTRPMSAIKSVVSGDKIAEGLGLGIYSLLILFLTMMLHLPIGDVSKEIEIGYRARLGIVAVVGVLILILVGAVVNLLAQKVTNQKMQYGFVQILAALGLVTLPASVCFILGFVLGFFAVGVSVFVYVFGVACYVRFSLYVFNASISDNEDKKVMISAIVSLITMVITAFVCYYILGSMVRTILVDFYNDLLTDSNGIFRSLFRSSGGLY